MTRVLREKSQVADSITTVDKQTTQLATQKATQKAQTPTRTLTLTKAQFDSLVNQVVVDLKREKGSKLTVADVTGSHLTDLDKILLLNALYRSPNAAQVLDAEKDAALKDGKVDPNIALVKRLDQVIDRLEAINSTQIKQGAKSSDETRQLEQQLKNQLDRPDNIVVATQDAKGEVSAQEVQIKPLKKTFTFDRVAAFTGLNIGGQLGLNVGARAYLQFRNTKFDLVPDFYFNFGRTLGFGLNANVHYNLPSFLKDAVSPYVGVGLGLDRLGGVTRFRPNYVVGTSLNKVLGGRLFVDYTVRGAFSSNQLAVGYRYNF